MSEALPVRHVLLKRWCEITGRSASRVRDLIANGTLAEGVHYRKDPMGRININIAGMDRWIEGR